MYDDFLGTYDSFYRYDIGGGLRALHEKRIEAFDTESASGICGGRYGSGIRMVVVDPGDGYVGTDG